MELFVLENIAAVAAGAGGWAIIHHFAAKRKKDTGLDDYAANLIMQENRELREKNNLVEGYNARHVKEIAELKTKIHELTMKNEILHAFPFQVPLPMWSVDRNHCYDYINKLYEDIFLRQFGKTAEECLGKNLYEVWPKIIADQFIENNKRVMENDEIMNALEDVAKADGNIERWRIIKMKRPYPLGLIGFAVPVNGFFDKHFKKIA